MKAGRKAGREKKRTGGEVGQDRDQLEGTQAE